jgi:hypothetical protein
MDSASQTFSVDQIADLVLERLMEKNGSLVPKFKEIHR